MPATARGPRKWSGSGSECVWPCPPLVRNGALWRAATAATRPQGGDSVAKASTPRGLEPLPLPVRRERYHSSCRFPRVSDSRHMPSIHVDDDVAAALAALGATPGETVNTVLRRLLFAPSDGATSRRGQALSVPWRTRKQVTPKATYERCLLHVLASQFGGVATRREATEATLRMMWERGLLTPTAGELLASNGETKGENAVAWGRQGLKDVGLLKANSPRGVWELTPEGLAKGHDPMLLGACGSSALRSDLGRGRTQDGEDNRTNAAASPRISATTLRKFRDRSHP
jgi:hypothetical protein